MNVGIRPVDRPQSTGSTDGVNRREDGSGSSAFSPKTNVSIKNAVDDMAGILAKISSNQAEAVDKMPEDLQKMIQNVMKQAFSLNESLGQGLGSTMESQRFSMDQLGTLSRMLSQLGNLAEKGTTAEVSDTLQALLTNLKTMVGTDSSASLEPVLLTKAAFELLDTKDVSDLPEQLQQLLASLQPQGQTAAMTAGESSPMAFLKQLVQYFMPRPAADSAAGASTAEQNTGGTAQNGQAAQQAAGNTAASQTATQNAPNTANTQNGQQSSGQNTGNGSNAQSQANQAGQSAAQTGTANQPGTAGQMQQPETAQNQPGNTAGQPAGQQTAGNAAQAEQQPEGARTTQTNLPGQLQNGQSGQGAQTTANGQNLQQPQGSQQGTAGQTAAQPGQEQAASQPGQSSPEQANGQANAQSQVQENNPLLRQQSAAPGANQQAENMPQQSAANQAKTQLMMQTMENTTQAMDTMKSLAQLLLNDAELTQKDTTLLQNFVNGQSSQLSEKDAKQLQTMIRLCQANIPAAVQQAAVQQEIPDLPRLWAFMQLCDMSVAKKMNARQLKRAGKDVATFVTSMRNAMGGENSNVQGQRSLNFMLPMYMGEESTYPSYIHVYDEKQQDPETGEMRKETWLRICVLTDNIGAVELTCRVYNDSQLDMRLFFSDTDTANEFREQVDSLKDSLKDSTLKLNDLKIGAAGERRFI